MSRLSVQTKFGLLVFIRYNDRANYSIYFFDDDNVPDVFSTHRMKAYKGS
jgi:hypothetical protein